MSKRRRFVVTSLLLSLGFILIQFLDERYRFLSIAALGVLTLILFAWSLKEGLGKNLTLVSLILPVFFTFSVGLFWFLLPASIFTRIPAIVFYGVGIYALCLTSNIYTVSAIRTIALFRAARGVGFVLSLVTFFLTYDTILSLRTPLGITSLLVGIFSFPLFFQGLWAINLEKIFRKEVILLTGIVTLIMVEIATLMFFWPVSVAVGSLFLSTAVYVTLGLGQAYLEARLFQQTIREYLLVGAIVLLGMFLATSWRG